MKYEHQPMRQHKRGDNPDQYIHIRQWLNIIFMLGAIVGLCVYFFGDKTVGTYFVLVAMLFKMVECVLRFIK